MDYHVEKEYTICSDALLPFFKTYCRDGFYVSIAFTAREYYVLVQGSTPGEFVAYKVEVDDEITYANPDQDELEIIRDVLKEATGLFKSPSSVETILKRINERPLIINTVKPIGETVAEKLRKAEKEIHDRKKIPVNIKHYVDLYGVPNVAVYPKTVAGEIKLVDLANDFMEKGLECQRRYGAKKEELMVPMAYPFDTELYRITASAEIVNRCCNKTIYRYIKSYLDYKVSRWIVYHQAFLSPLH